MTVDEDTRSDSLRSRSCADQSNSIFCCFTDSTQTLLNSSTLLFNVNTSLAQERQMKFEYSSSSESINHCFVLKGYIRRKILGINQIIASQSKCFWWWIIPEPPFSPRSTGESQALGTRLSPFSPYTAEAHARNGLELRLENCEITADETGLEKRLVHKTEVH